MPAMRRNGPVVLPDSRKAQIRTVKIVFGTLF